jgi:glycosyltransferase involved in cell wall biosynthesis
MRFFENIIASAYMGHWTPYTRIFLVRDRASWVLDNEANELSMLSQKLGIRQGPSRWSDFSRKQSLFYTSQFFLLSDTWYKSDNRVAVAYFHGRPGSGVSDFDQLYDNVRRHHESIDRIQVSHSEMHDIILESGIAPEKVFRIPIGINLSFLQLQKPETKKTVRLKYGIPETAIVIGSLLKDGVGWGEGLEPKMIKGPDVFLRTVEILKGSMPDIFILLSGPARGYVKKGLERFGLPYKHLLFKDYSEIGSLYQALDLCLVTSRQEGGPKAILEAMASGVPIVTTRVGQAMDLVQHGKNGFMVEIEDTEGLAHWSKWVFDHPSAMKPVLEQGRQTAEQNTYTKQLPLWHEFMKGFVSVRS